ncbi:MAG: hypothetical protein VYD66_06175 [Candidatus Neomarinimicrobiota bacterium]|nr:hypothetical protein [Candidatus Neomarinimicrobiota bacterium]
MKKLFAVLALALNQLFSLDLHGIETMTGWENLQSGSVSISWCTYDNLPISKAETVLNHSIDRISMVIQDLDNYPDIFNRVTKTKRLETDVVQIVLDMPFPFDGRDYIVKYNIENLDGRWTFVFTAVDHPQGTLDTDHVRLPNAAGIWILTALEPNKTKVIYAWNGELLGNFPDFGLIRAWITQGTEVLNWLDEELTKRTNS